jgi:hypothetical protein
MEKKQEEPRIGPAIPGKNRLSRRGVDVAGL